MTKIQIYGNTCQIKAEYYPCIHTCNVLINNFETQLTDFINNCNTVPLITFKNGFYENNCNNNLQLIREYYLEQDLDNNFLVFYLYNFNKEKNWLALKHIEYQDKILENVLHT